MHSKGNWILRRDCQAKGRSDFYNCHSPLWGSQWIFDLPLQKQRPANLGKVESSRQDCLEFYRDWKIYNRKEKGNLAMEMAFWQEEFIELVLFSMRFYLVIFVRLSVGLFTEMLNKQL